MKIHGNFQKLEMCGISNNGAIQITKKHREQGIHEKRVSTSAYLRYWKHWMRCHNENQSGNLFLFTHKVVHHGTLCMHRYIRFNGIDMLWSMLVIFFNLHYVLVQNWGRCTIYAY
jgi:hypothetical protein